ncbi:MAG: hypothetical protein Q9160_002376 [Pyrenula sp. 1 TL-2023]
MVNDSQHVRDLLSYRRQNKWGFIIYRCTYKNDAQWARFMELLNEWTRQNLEYDKALDLMDSLDWNIREDPKLDGTSKREIRRIFNEWLDQYADYRDTSPRYEQCIMVDQECVESVLDGAQPSDENSLIKDHGYVYLIDARWKPDEDDDDVYSPIDGCTLTDVGWQKVAAGFVAPRAFNLMGEGGWGWDTYYVRPPGVFDL